MLSTIVNIEVLFPSLLELTLLGVGVGLDIVDVAVSVGEEIASELEVVDVVIPEVSIGDDNDELITLELIREVMRVVDGDETTGGEFVFVVAMVVGWAEEISGEAIIVGEEKASVVVPVVL